MDNIYEKILEKTREMPVIDTHEHLENEDKHMKWNVLSDYTQHYFVCDLISAGLPPEVIPVLAKTDGTILEKWDLLEPFWNYCRHTGYGQVLDLAAQTLYGVDKIDRDTIETVEKGFQTLRSNKGFSSRLLRDNGIVAIMNNIWRLDGDSAEGLYHFVNQIDDYVMFNVDDLKLSPITISGLRTIDDWISNCLNTIDYDFRMNNAAALKLAVAYKRSLLFNQISHSEAEEGYQLFRAGRAHTNLELLKSAQDYVMHSILEVANQNNWLLQIHTGYQEGNGGNLQDSNPGNITNLLIQYPNIRFDLFHMGFPYQQLCGALGKMFPNVRLNLCWAHMLSPLTTINTLKEWLYTIPINKIFAFGGDCRFFDGTIGHLELARRNVSRVLADCVHDGLFPYKRAVQIARSLFFDNPRDFYHW